MIYLLKLINKLKKCNFEEKKIKIKNKILKKVKITQKEIYRLEGDVRSAINFFIELITGNSNFYNF